MSAGFQEQEKCRVLEEALNVLAKEHHELEQSLVTQASSGQRNKTRSPRFYDTSDDEFYDAFEAGELLEKFKTNLLSAMIFSFRLVLNYLSR